MTSAYLQAQAQSPPSNPSSSNRPPSSRRALTRALELAQEAVRIDASNDNPEAAVLAYAKSVALLNEVMERVMRGEDTEGSRRKPGSRRRSVVAKEDEARRLRSIHDTYADRMHILTLIYNIPQPSLASLSSPPASSTYSNSLASTATLVDFQQDGLLTPSDYHFLQGRSEVDDSYDAAEAFESTMLSSTMIQEGRNYDDSEHYGTNSASVSRSSSIHHPSRVTNLPPIRPPPSGPPPTRPRLDSLPARRTSRMAPPTQPPPTAPPPPPPRQHHMHYDNTPPQVSYSETSHTESFTESQHRHPTDDMDSWDGHHNLHSQFHMPPQNVPHPPSRSRSATLESEFGGRRRSPPLPPIPKHEHEDVPQRHPFAAASGASHFTEEFVPSSRPVTPASQSHYRPRGNTQSSATSSRSEGESSAYSDRPRTPPPAVPLLVSTSTAQGTISQRRKSGNPAGSVDSHLSVAYEQPGSVSQPISRAHSPAAEPSAYSRSAGPTPMSASAGSTSNLSVAVSRNRALSQPGRRPSVGQLYSGPSADHEQPPPLPMNPPPLPRKTSFTAGFAAPRNHSDGTPPIHHTNLPALNLSTPPPTPFQPSSMMSHQSPTSQPLSAMPSSPLPTIPPVDPLRRPYHLMGLLHNTISSPTGGYLTKRLHVPHDVWTQGGAKLNNITEKAKCVAFLEVAIEELNRASTEFLRIGISSSAAAVGLSGPGIAQASANRWIRALDEWLSVCDTVVANFGKKLGLGEGIASKKTAGWGNKVTRAVDRMTNGKNLDSPAQYASNLSQLFSTAQLFDDHHRVLGSQSPLGTYASIPPDARAQIELRLKRSSDFFSSVVLAFVLRDLGQLLDKFAKKGERWMEE